LKLPTKSKILIVDDEPNMRLTLFDILTDEGYDVDLAEDGETAVRMCQEQQYDIILLDVRMPGINGVEAFRQIRQHNQQVRVIMMSAFVIDDLKKMALDEGAIAYLDKPLDVDTVIRLVDEALETAILIVENDELIAQSLESRLKGQNFRVTVVDSPHTALELVEQIQFDIIFIDAVLPSMNGLELYLAVKERSPNSVAIMISGLEEEHKRIASEAVRHTAYTVVHKPLDFDHLLNLMRKLKSQKISDAIEKPDDG